jgi:hypothetical protein
VDAGLGQVEILTEYQLPLTSMRVDAVLAGVHPKTGGDSYVIIELKRWSAATSFDESPRLVTVEHVPRPRLHPGLQPVEGLADPTRLYMKRKPSDAVTKEFSGANNPDRQRR